jgi:Rrf2 family protein
MISQTAQYALRAVVCLALHHHASLTTGQLAEMTKVSPEYLSKVMQALVRADVVTSKPGKTGGFSLKVPPETLSVLAIVDAIDPQEGTGPYSLDMQSYGSILRPLHQRLAQINAAARREYGRIMISELLPPQPRGGSVN